MAEFLADFAANLTAEEAARNTVYLDMTRNSARCFCTRNRGEI